MQARRGIKISLLLTLVLLAGCASRQYDSLPAVAVETDTCTNTFEQWQEQVEGGNHFDAQTWSPAGFPYLRVNRLLASFPVDELSVPQRRGWLERAHELAVTAWHFEAASLGGNARNLLPELQHCGQAAIAELLESDSRWQQLQDASTVPDSYSTSSRVLGGYPAVAPVVRWRAGVVMGELMDEFGEYQFEHPFHVYEPEPVSADMDVAALLRRASARSQLGIPDFRSVERKELLQHYAPAWVVETAGSSDLPGRPGRGQNGDIQFRPEPAVFSQVAYTRLNGQVLPQLVYTLWFPRRPAEGAFDIVAGELDGFVWRVTLGENGRPLIYDSMHPCGCYHTWVLAPGGLEPRGETGFWEEPLWIAGTAPETDQGVVLYLASGTHYLMGVATKRPEDEAETRRYSMEPYGHLRGPSFAGGRLFNREGMIAGTERLERYFLWPTGVPSPGAMRQWGHHATAFVGTRHFDDPGLLKRYFVQPE